ncbi:MAG TPA: lanthionine synthetase C family protein [Amycolatopsis sp.]
MNPVEAIAAALRSPDEVVAITDAPGNLMHTNGSRRSPWVPLSLSDGYPAIALLFAELAADDPSCGPLAHDYLTRAMDAGPTAEPGLFRGPVALAFAAHNAALGSGGYSSLLSALDAAISASAYRHSARLRESLHRLGVVGSWCYDVISGSTGIGRYLLARGDGDALRTVLSSLVEVAVAEDSGKPGWWVLHDVSSGPRQVAEHLNFGVAHGIGGPLALLSLAWTAGIRVPRHDEAITRIVEVLARWRAVDSAGPYWPNWLGDLGGGTPAVPRVRDVWCYGTAGLARALYLAGRALGSGAWLAEANAAFRAVLVTEGGAIHDFSLCHGWAGLLQITTRMARDTGLPAYWTAADGMAERIATAFDPEKPFGYHLDHPVSRLGPNRPGFLDGAAGIALALHNHARRAAPRTDWDAALLIA